MARYRFADTRSGKRRLAELALGIVVADDDGVIVVPQLMLNQVGTQVVEWASVETASRGEHQKTGFLSCSPWRNTSIYNAHLENGGSLFLSHPYELSLRAD